MTPLEFMERLAPWAPMCRGLLLSLAQGTSDWFLPTNIEPRVSLKGRGQATGTAIAANESSL
jgi:hypothetical protein